MPFSYRIKLYVFGFLMGLFLLAVILKGKKCSSTNELKIEELSMQQVYFTDRTRCLMKCFGLQDTAIANTLKNYQVNYDRSDVHLKPYAKYFVEAKSNQSKEYSLIIEDRDSSSFVVDFNFPGKIDTCGCK